MKMMTVAFFTFLRHVRDYGVMLALIAFPLALIALLGSSQESEFTPRVAERMSVGYLSEDQGEFGNVFDNWMHSEEIVSLIEIREVSSIADAERLIQSKTLSGFVHVPADASAALQQGRTASLRYIGRLHFDRFQPMLDSFVETHNVKAVLVKLGFEQTKDSEEEPFIQRYQVETAGKIPSAMDYFSISMLLQVLMYGGLLGIFVITKDYGNRTHMRHLTAPVGSGEVMLGKWFGSTIVLFLIGLVVCLTTDFGYGANWDGSLWLIGIVIFLFCAASISLGMLIAYWIRNTMGATLCLFFLSTLFSATSGGYFDMEGKSYELLGQISPSFYAHKALFADIHDRGEPSGYLIGLLLYTLLIMTVAYVSGRRKTV